MSLEPPRWPGSAFHRLPARRRRRDLGEILALIVACALTLAAIYAGVGWAVSALVIRSAS